MNHIICIEHVRNRGQYEPIAGPELLEKLAGPLSLLNQLSVDNLAFLADPQGAQLPGGGLNGPVQTGGYMVPRRTSSRKAAGQAKKTRRPPPVEMLNLRQVTPGELHGQTLTELQDFTNVELQKQILNQVQAMMNIEDGKLEDLRFVENVQLHGYWGQIDVSRTLVATPCPDCGNLVSVAALNAHQGTLKCMLATGNRDMRDQGWQTIQSSHHFQALKSAGIPCDIRPSELAVWVPPWAAKAIEQFEGKEEGYAGMKLTDFLRKMNPT